MTPTDYTAFRERIRRDYPKMYNELPTEYSVSGWLDFVRKLLDTVETVYETQMSGLAHEVEVLEERLVNCD